MTAKHEWPLPIEARNYDEFITKLLDIQKSAPHNLERVIDACESILGLTSDHDVASQSFLHSISCNLVEIIKSSIRWDKTGSLRYLYQKVTNEIAKIPFELHLALSLNIELSKPSAGSMFYFPYLEELLAFIENTSLFLKYFRLFSAIRVSAGEVSQLDGLATYKINSKFGDAEDLSLATQTYSLQSADVIKKPTAAIKFQATLQTWIVAYNTEQLAFDFSLLGSEPDLLDSTRFEKMLAGESTKQYKRLPLVVFSYQSSCVLLHRGLEVVCSLTFIAIVESLAVCDSIDYDRVCSSRLAAIDIARYVDLGLFTITVSCR